MAAKTRFLCQLLVSDATNIFLFRGYIYKNKTQRVLLKLPPVVDLIKRERGPNEKRVNTVKK